MKEKLTGMTKLMSLIKKIVTDLKQIEIIDSFMYLMGTQNSLEFAGMSSCYKITLKNKHMSKKMEVYMYKTMIGLIKVHASEAYPHKKKRKDYKCKKG